MKRYLVYVLMALIVAFGINEYAMAQFGGGGAFASVRNFLKVCNTNILPSVDDTYTLGSTGKEWKTLWIDGTAQIDSLVADTADINGGTIDGITALTASGDLDIGAHDLQAQSLSADGLTQNRLVVVGADGLLSDATVVESSGALSAITTVGTSGLITATTGAAEALRLATNASDYTKFTMDANGGLAIESVDAAAAAANIAITADGTFAITSTGFNLSSAGALSGVTSLAMGGALSGATTGAFSSTVTITPGTAVNGLYINQDQNAVALNIDSESAGNVALNIAGGGVSIGQDITSRYGLYVQRDIGEAGSTDLVRFINDNTSDTKVTLSLKNDGSGAHIATIATNEDLEIDPNGTGSTVLMAANGNAAQIVGRVRNTDEGAAEETGQTASLSFGFMGTINSGSAYTAHEAARLEAYKVSDWYHASDDSDHDSGLKIYVTDAGTETLALTIDEAGLVTLTGDIAVNGDNLTCDGALSIEPTTTVTLLVPAAGYVVIDASTTDQTGATSLLDINQDGNTDDTDDQIAVDIDVVRDSTTDTGGNVGIDIDITTSNMASGESAIGVSVDFDQSACTTATSLVYGFKAEDITGDAQVTEVALDIGTGWDTAISAGELNITNVGDIALDSISADDAGSGTIKIDNILRARKFTIGHADLTDGDTSEDEALFTLPAGGMVTDVYAYVFTAFAGGGVGSCTVAVGTTDADLLAEEHDVLGTGNTVWILEGQDATDKGAGLFEPTDKTRLNYVVTSSTNIIAQFDVDTTCAALTTGSIDIYVVYLIAE